MLALFIALFGSLCLMVGVLTFPVAAGALSLSFVGVNGLFVILFALMIVFMGFTPLGTQRRSWLLFVVGLAVVAFGSIAVMSPGFLDRPIALLLAGILIAKGAIRLPYFIIRRDAEKQPSSLITVTFALMHVACLVLGIMFFLPSSVILGNAFAVVLCLLGLDQIVLGIAVRKAGKAAEEYLGFVSAEKVRESEGETRGSGLLGTVDIAPSQQAMLLIAVIVGCMAVCAYLGGAGIIAYDVDASMALFVFATGIQILLTRDTPIKKFKPSAALTALGMAITILAMVACIVPGSMDSAIGVLMVISNLLTAVFGILHMVAAGKRLRGKAKDAGPKNKGIRAMTHLVISGCFLYSCCFLYAVNIALPGVLPPMLMLLVLCCTTGGLIRLVVLFRRVAHLGIVMPD